MRKAVLESDDDMRASWSGPLLLLDVAEVPREDDDPILALTGGDGAKKASVVLGRVASWRAAAVRNEAALRLRRGAGAAIVVLVLFSHFSVDLWRFCRSPNSSINRISAVESRWRKKTT